MNHYVLTFTALDGQYVRREIEDRILALSAFRQAKNEGARNVWLVYRTPLTAETVMGTA